MKLTNEFDTIREWANQRGLLVMGDNKTQVIKLYEEAGELSQAILKKSKDDMIDAIGDCIIVLTNLAAINDIKIEDCINSAYNEIKDREGVMKNGTFVKNI